MRAGAGRSIAGTVNSIPEIISVVIRDGRKRPNLPSFINELIKHPIFPAVKALISDRKELMSWLRVRDLLLKCNSRRVGNIPENRRFVPFLICFLATFSAIDVLKKLSMGG